MSKRRHSEGRFCLGRTVATRGAISALTERDIQSALARHLAGEWGEVCEEDRRANEEALVSGARLLSVYHTAGGLKFWIITEADRSVTTVLLPEEY